jgi:hypothetical protein
MTKNDKDYWIGILCIIFSIVFSTINSWLALFFAVMAVLILGNLLRRLL